MQMIKSIKPAIKHLYSDKVNLIFTLIPLTIGLLLYYSLGSWFFTTFINKGEAYIKANISNGTGSSILYWILASLLTLVLYFVVSWTFVMVVSIVSSPFNDMISKRIEKKKKGEALDSMSKSFSNMFSKSLFVIFTEAKKLLFICSLTVLALLLNFFPILAPISFALSALLLATQFLDYSWSRNDLSFSECFKSLRSDFIPYTISGAGFMALISIPVINLIVPPLATSYFTDYFVEKTE